MCNYLGPNSCHSAQEYLEGLGDGRYGEGYSQPASEPVSPTRSGNATPVRSEETDQRVAAVSGEILSQTTPMPVTLQSSENSVVTVVTQTSNLDPSARRGDDTVYPPSCEYSQFGGSVQAELEAL